MKEYSFIKAKTVLKDTFDKESQWGDDFDWADTQKREFGQVRELVLLTCNQSATSINSNFLHKVQVCVMFIEFN